tara:strand:- start:1345 stop:1989 length:645 start_codon:yes stop_codon:yes gene_type:complete
MSELRFAGITFKGGKLVGIIVALSTLIGGAYGVFEVYKDYTDMKAKINSYVAPDLSGFTGRLDVFEAKLNGLEVLLETKIDRMDKTLDTKIESMDTLLKSEINTAMELVTAAQGDARDIRNELRKDINEVMDAIANVDKRSRTQEIDNRTAIRNSEGEVKDLIQNAENRFDGKRTAIESDATRRSEALDVKLKELEERLRTMLQRALNNPLSGE